MDGNEIFFNDHARLNSFAGLYPEKHQKATVSYRLETNENLMKVGLAKEISTYSWNTLFLFSPACVQAGSLRKRKNERAK